MADYSCDANDNDAHNRFMAWRDSEFSDLGSLAWLRIVFPPAILPDYEKLDYRIAGTQTLAVSRLYHPLNDRHHFFRHGRLDMVCYSKHR